MLIAGIFAGAWAGTRTTMQSMIQDLEPLLSLTLDESGWGAGMNRSKIESGLKSLVKHSHSLRVETDRNGTLDPAFTLLAPVLGQQVDLAMAAYRMGQFEYARETVRSLTSSCFACHSRMPGWDSQEPRGLPERLKALPLLEQARFQATLRRMDAALELYHEALLRPDFQKRAPLQWNRALREAMTLLIRVKRQPATARQWLSDLENSPDLPVFMKREMKGWIEDLRILTKDTARKTLDEEALARKITKAFRDSKSRRMYPMDHAADVRFLDLTSLLFEFERRFPASSRIAEVEFMQGYAHETLDTPPFSNLHELFYESCIRRSPHSGISKQCYEHLEKSVISGFTGSSGTHIPVDAKNRLLELWGLAFVPSKEVR